MATTTSAPPPTWGQRVWEQGLPIAVVLLFTLALWYALTVYLNAPWAHSDRPSARTTGLA